jgi:hypothetical protein
MIEPDEILEGMYFCHECGAEITASEADDNGGYCEVCAAPEDYDETL